MEDEKNGSPGTNFSARTKHRKELGTYGQSQRWHPRSVSDYSAVAFVEETDPLRFGSYASDRSDDLDNLHDSVPGARPKTVSWTSNFSGYAA
jgi:hypothetical protein